MHGDLHSNRRRLSTGHEPRRTANAGKRHVPRAAHCERSARSGAERIFRRLMGVRQRRRCRLCLAQLASRSKSLRQNKGTPKHSQPWNHSGISGRLPPFRRRRSNVFQTTVASHPPLSIAGNFQREQNLARVALGRKGIVPPGFCLGTPLMGFFQPRRKNRPTNEASRLPKRPVRQRLRKPALVALSAPNAPPRKRPVLHLHASQRSVHPQLHRNRNKQKPHPSPSPKRPALRIRKSRQPQKQNLPSTARARNPTRKLGFAQRNKAAIAPIFRRRSFTRKSSASAGFLAGEKALGGDLNSFFWDCLGD